MENKIQNNKMNELFEKKIHFINVEADPRL